MVNRRAVLVREVSSGQAQETLIWAVKEFIDMELEIMQRKTFHSGIMIVVQMKIYKVLKTTTHLMLIPYSQAAGIL
jgi:hypothetical protein